MSAAQHPAGGPTGAGKPWRIATRRSALAQAQARQIADALERATPRSAELVPMSTTGDRHPDRALEAFNTKGLFVDDTRNAVLSGDCDMVVHSAKDLPTEAAEGLVVAAYPLRADPRDALVTAVGWSLSSIPRNRVVTVGTSSTRRRAMLLKQRPDLIVQPIRGNLDTRLAKVRDGEVDAVVVAMAGLRRLAPVLNGLTVDPLEPGQMLSAAAQGALAVECRSDDLATRAVLAVLDDADTRACVTAEQTVLRELDMGCTAPVGALASVVTGPSARRIELLGALGDPAGTRLIRASHQGAYDDPTAVGLVMAETLRSNGADILERLSTADQS